MAQFEEFINILLDGSKNIEVSGDGNGFQNNESTEETISCGTQVGTVWGVTAKEWEKIYQKVNGKRDCISSTWLRTKAKKEWAVNYHFKPDVWEKCGFARVKSQYVANILADVFVQSYTKSFLNARKALNKMGEKLPENAKMIDSALVEAINRQTDLDEDLLIKLLKSERAKQGWGSRINKYPNRPGATNIYGTCKTSNSLVAQYNTYNGGDDTESDCADTEAADHKAQNGSKAGGVISNFFSRVKGGLDFSTSLWKQDIPYTLAFLAVVFGIGFGIYKLAVKK